MHDLSKYKYTQFIRTALRQFRRIVKCIETARPIHSTTERSDFGIWSKSIGTGND